MAKNPSITKEELLANEGKTIKELCHIFCENRNKIMYWVNKHDVKHIVNLKPKDVSAENLRKCFGMTQDAASDKFGISIDKLRSELKKHGLLEEFIATKGGVKDEPENRTFKCHNCQEEVVRFVAPDAVCLKFICDKCKTLDSPYAF